MTQSTTEELHELQIHSEHASVLEALSDLTEARLDEAHRGILKGISLSLSGQSEEALSFLMLATLTEVQASAETPDFRQDIAMALLLVGQIDQAVTMLSDLLSEGIEDAVVYGRLATAQLMAGDLDAAEKYYREAVNRETGRAEWHSNLAGVLVRQQRLEEALQNYDVALHLAPALEKAKSAREQLLVALDRGEDVIQDLQKDLNEAPDSLPARLKLARALARDNRAPEAFSTLMEALLPLEEVPSAPEHDQSSRSDQTPDTPSSWAGQVALRVALADVALHFDMSLRALAALNEVLSLKPEDPAPYIRQRISVLLELNRPEDAEVALVEAEEELGDVVPLQLARAQYLTETGQFIEAEKLQRDLLESYPGDMQLTLQLAQSLLWNGKLDEAVALYEQAAKTNPMALAHMVNAKNMPEDPKALAKMRDVADNPFTPVEPRVTMSFALSDVYDKQKNYDLAFQYLQQANELSDKTINYCADTFTRKVDETIDFFTEEFLCNVEDVRQTARTPVFVVGMPRSGTTLTEQILCSHPKVFGAGELGTVGRITSLMPRVVKSGQRYPQCLKNATVNTREQAARYYLRALDALDKEHPFVVDKMPHNFMNLGLISIILPRAKIIHIRRDPRDTALSNYQQNFKAKHGGMGFAFNLEKTARQINDYHRMMNHWRDVLPIPMFELTYEELVANQEEMTRILLDFIGLDWDDDVRDFHKTERAVRTASVAQVRQKIYQTSRQKWRRYEQFLSPLLDNLDPVTTALWDRAMATESGAEVTP